MIISQRLSLEGSGSLILQTVNGKCGVVDTTRLVQGTNLGLLHKDIHFVLTEEFFSASQRCNVGRSVKQNLCFKR